MDGIIFIDHGAVVQSQVQAAQVAPPVVQVVRAVPAVRRVARVAQVAQAAQAVALSLRYGFDLFFYCGVLHFINSFNYCTCCFF